MTHLSEECFQLFDAVFQAYDIPIRSISAEMFIAAKNWPCPYAFGGPRGLLVSLQRGVLDTRMWHTTRKSSIHVRARFFSLYAVGAYIALGPRAVTPCLLPPTSVACAINTTFLGVPNVRLIFRRVSHERVVLPVGLLWENRANGIEATARDRG
jgi:hypothetical protein